MFAFQYENQNATFDIFHAVIYMNKQTQVAAELLCIIYTG